MILCQCYVYIVGFELACIFEECYGMFFVVVCNVLFVWVEFLDVFKFYFCIIFYQGVLNEGWGLEIVIVVM